MKNAHILSILLVLAITVSAGCQAKQTGSSEASATADSAAAKTDKREITNGFIEKKSDDLPQLDLTNAIADPMKYDDYGHDYILKDWSAQKCEDFAKSMSEKGFKSEKVVDGGEIVEFYVYSSDEYYCFSPNDYIAVDDYENFTEEEEALWASYWYLEWYKTSSAHTGEAPDSNSALSAIKAVSADTPISKYLLDGCLVDESSDALYASMGLKYCCVQVKCDKNGTRLCDDRYLVGKTKAVSANYSDNYDFDSRLICDIDSDGEAEAVFIQGVGSGNYYYYVTFIGVKNGDPYIKYYFTVNDYDDAFKSFNDCEEISVDKETQALVFSCSSHGSGEKSSCTLKVKNGELISEKSN